jgi:hypothetical protein
LDVWNIYHKKDGDAKLLHLTNNGLEHYNRHFNGICSQSHQNLVDFAHALHSEANRVVQRMDDVAKGREIHPYSEPCFPDIPHAFYQEKQPRKPKAKRVAKKGRSRK